MKGFTELGFKTQTQPLSSFQENYGLEAGEDEDEGDEDSEDEEGSDEEMEDGSSDEE